MGRAQAKAEGPTGKEAGGVKSEPNRLGGGLGEGRTIRFRIYNLSTNRLFSSEVIKNLTDRKKQLKVVSNEDIRLETSQYP